jgi:hypothetical protein
MMTIALALMLQDEFFKFPAETSWTYKRVQNDQERVITAKVLGEKDGRVRLDWTEAKLDGTLQENSEVTWLVKEGILWAEVRAKGEEAVSLALPVLKVGSKKDDTWTTDAGASTHQGTEEVKVPAGTYKDAVHTSLKAEGDTLINFYIVPKVGLVKVTVASAGGDAITFELKEFKPAK